MLLLSACAAQSAPGDIAGATRALAVEECAQRLRCDPVWFSRTWTSVAQCEERTALQYRAMLWSPSTRLTPKWANDCAAALRDDQCKDERPAACALVPGRGLAGARCYSGADCDTLSCTYHPDAAKGWKQPACGTCEPRFGGPRVCATPCASDEACVGARCVKRANEGEACTEVACVKGMTCVSGVCRATVYAREGEPCGNLSTGSVECAGALRCSDRSGSTAIGQCVAPAEDGAPCDDDVGPGCVPPARCVDKACTLPDVAACP